MSKDLFAPPSQEELETFAPPSKEELEMFAPPKDSEKQDKPIEAAVTGAFQGATAGFSEGAAAGINAAIDVAIDKLTPNLDRKPKEFKFLYNKNLAALRDHLHSLAESNPKAFTGGEIAGVIGGAIATGGKNIIAKGIAQAAKAAGAGTVLKGAAAGGLAGAGYSEEEGAELLKDTAKGAALGAGIGALGKAVSGGVKAVGRGLGKAADYTQLQALGLAANKFKNLAKADKQEIVKYAREKGILAGNVEQTVENAKELKRLAEEQLSSVVSKIKSKAGPSVPFIEPEELVPEILDDIHRGLVKGAHSSAAKLTYKLVRMINRTNPYDFDDVRQLRTNIGSHIREQMNKSPVGTSAAKAVYRKVEENLDKMLDNLDSHVGDKNLLAQFKEANKAYKFANTLEKATEFSKGMESGVVQRELSRPLQASTAGTGLIGRVLGGPLGLITSSALRLTKARYGASGAAKLQRLIEKGGPTADKINKLIQENNIDALAPYLSGMAIGKPSDQEVEDKKEQTRQILNQLKMP